MEVFVKANRISKYHMRMLTENTRILTTMLLVFLFLVQNLSSVLSFSKSVKIPVTPYAFVFLVNDYICQFIIIACAVVIFSNAPFEDEGYPYMLPRAGRTSWAFGQIIYIFKVSWMYVIFLIISSILPFIGHLSLDVEWGKIWGTLAMTDAGSRFGLNFSISNLIVNDYTPVQAFVLSVLLEWACIAWIGLLIYFGNKMTNRSIGTIAGMFFTFLDVCIANDWMAAAYGVSPVSLAQIKTYSGYALKHHIDLTYGIRFFIFGILAFILLCFVVNNKNRIGRSVGCMKKKMGE